MRTIVALGAVLLCATGAFPQSPTETKPAARYGVEPDLLDYPQAKPQDALASVLKAIEAGQIRYLLAQLADPTWVDQRVRQVHGGKFEAMVEETTSKLSNDRAGSKELERFSREGTWEVGGDRATATLKEVPNRQVFMRKLNGRWFLESRRESAAETEK
jgi:hypothetical protein